MTFNIKKFLLDHTVPDRAAFFLPVYGIGDKLRFFSYLHLFEIFNDCPARVLVSSDFDNSLLTCFPELHSKSLQIPLSTAHLLYVNDRLMADNVSLTPGPGLVFPTWHHHYLNGQGTRWEQVNQQHVTHDLFVKQALHVPAIFSPSKLVLPRCNESIVKRDRILLAPFSVSTPATPLAIWLDLAARLSAVGFEVICNVGLGGRKPFYEQNYTELIERYESFEKPISELISLLNSFSGVVTTRTGLSDLLSLTNVPSVTLTPNSINRFWDIPNHGGRHIEIRCTPDMNMEIISQKTVQFILGA